MPGQSGFAFFGREHLGALAVIVLFAVALTIATRRLAAQSNAAGARAVCRGLALLLVGTWIARDVGDALAGHWSVQESLPLHLCGLGVFTAALALWFAPGPLPNERVRRLTQICYELTYYWGLAGTTQALLTPGIADPFPSRAFIQYFILHGGIVIAVAVLTFGLRQRPGTDSVLRTWLITALVALPVGCVSWLMGANYMYLLRPPPRPSLYDYFGRWPWPLAAMAALGLVLFSLLYVPFWAGRRGARPHG